MKEIRIVIGMKAKYKIIKVKSGKASRGHL